MAKRYIALLRGVNVGGRKAVGMSDLRNLLTELGLTEVRSLLQSGNLVFHAARGNAGEIEDLLAAKTAEQLDLQTDFLIRSAKDWAAMIDGNPFPDEAKRDPSHLLAFLLKGRPEAKAVAALRAAIVGAETIVAGERHLYVFYPDGIGRSRLTHALIEAKLGLRGTGRNWNTVLKLAVLAAEGI